MVASGMPKTKAFATLRPASKCPDKGAEQLFRRQDVIERIAELRMEIATRSVMPLEEKRDLLRRMIEGTVPTLVKKTAKGVEATYDRLGALQLDAKISGELEPDRLLLNPASDLTLTFEMYPRNDRFAPREWIEAELIPEPSAKELEIKKAADADLSYYEDKKVKTPDLNIFELGKQLSPKKINEDIAPYLPDPLISPEE